MSDQDAGRQRRTPEEQAAWERRRRRAEVFGEALPDTTADEREPSFTADARTLFFSSDRGESFDLYRSVLERGTWLP
ncbi:MAG: hypothetical protein ACPF9W_04920, partial [Nocardioides sp.]